MDPQSIGTSFLAKTKGILSNIVLVLCLLSRNKVRTSLFVVEREPHLQCRAIFHRKHRR
jgi:hypothetical protein